MRIIAILLVVSLFLGLNVCAIEEIAHQNVKYGDYIKQYAVINLAESDGGTVLDYCVDCNAYITVFRDKKIYINNKTMENISTGLFGYKATTALNYNTTYDMVVYTISPTYGDGRVYSKITINSKSDIFQIKTATISNTGLWNDIYDSILENIPGGGGLIFAKSYLSEIFDNNTLNALYAYIAFWVYIFKNALEIFAASIDTLMELGSAYIGFCIEFWNPETRLMAMSNGYHFILNIFIPILKWLLAPIIALEFYIIRQTSSNRGMNRMGKFITIHIDYASRAMMVFRQFFDFVFDLTKFIVETIINSVAALTNAIPL